MKNHNYANCANEREHGEQLRKVGPIIVNIADGKRRAMEETTLLSSAYFVFIFELVIGHLPSRDSNRLS
jgi:hypothetical protein